MSKQRAPRSVRVVVAEDEPRVGDYGRRIKGTDIRFRSFDELLAKAIRYTRPGGRVTLALLVTHRGQRPCLELMVVADGKRRRTAYLWFRRRDVPRVAQWAGGAFNSAGLASYFMSDKP